MNLLIEQAVNQVINGHDPSMTLAVGLNSIFLPYGSSSRRITGASSKNTTPCGFPWSIELGREPAMAGKNHQTRPGTKMYKEGLRMCQTPAQLAQLARVAQIAQVAQAFLIS
jgi:hypothetical protein